MSESLCTVEECTSEVLVKRRGLCSKHYQRLIRLGTTERLLPERGTTCSIDDCDNKQYALDLCRNHYTRKRQYGRTELLEVEIKYCHCGLIAQGRGMCKKHYQTWWYRNRELVHNELRAGTKRLETPGYLAAHDRVRTDKGHPYEYACVDCGGTAKEWSLNADAEDVLYGPSNTARTKPTKYSLNPDDYDPRCTNCHRAYDARTGNRNYKNR